MSAMKLLGLVCKYIMIHRNTLTIQSQNCSKDTKHLISDVYFGVKIIFIRDY